MQDATPQKAKEQESLFWQVLPTRFLMRFFRHIDKQESPTLTHTVGHVAGSLMLIAVPAAVLIFWKHIPDAVSFLFGDTSLLRQSITVEVWQLLPLMLLSIGVGFLFRRRRTVIHCASFYTEKERRDITAIVAKEVKKGILRIPASIDLFGDPDFGTPKKLTIEYSGWARQTKTVQEHGYIDLK